MLETDCVPESLADLLFPLSQEEFFRSYWGKAFLHIAGRSGKFSALFPWRQLNAVLEHYRLSPTRMRLVKEGAAVKPGLYLQIINGKPSSLKEPDFTRQLAEGATIIIDEADDLYGPLRELVISLERVFRIPIQTNLYAGWRTNRGFKLHWDAHDVLVLQVAGRKFWKVYQPTREFPLRDDYEEAPPPEKLVWEGVLQEGGLIYVPRGWWHVAQPLNEPCLHLTVGLHNATGMTFMRWFTETLESIQELRQDLPHWAGPEQRTAHMETLKQSIMKAWGPGLMDTFFTERDAQAMPRVHLRLPEVASSVNFSLQGRCRVRLAAPRTLDLRSDSQQGMVLFKSCGREWQCDDCLLPLLKILNKDGKAKTVDELLSHAPEGTQRLKVEESLRKLLSQGLLLIDGDSEGPSQPLAHAPLDEMQNTPLEIDTVIR